MMKLHGASPVVPFGASNLEDPRWTGTSASSNAMRISRVAAPT